MPLTPVSTQVKITGPKVCPVVRPTLCAISFRKGKANSPTTVQRGLCLSILSEPIRWRAKVVRATVPKSDQFSFRYRASRASLSRQRKASYTHSPPALP